MTREEIKEYNRLCAEFLGMYDYSKDNEGFEKGECFCYPDETQNPGSGYFDLSRCLISDWNWIMEVVEAIEKLDNFYVQIEESACYIYDISKFTDEQCHPFISVDSGLESKKEAVVEAIYKFLKWKDTQST